MEQNKTGKYLKYAVGEIVLVVIGILIALSINNWNEGRKSQEFENKLITEIYDALNDNIETVNRSIHFNLMAKNSSNIILSHFESNETYQDSLEEHFSKSLFWYKTNADYGAYETAKTYGLHSIANDNIRSLLSEIYEGDFQLVATFQIRNHDYFYQSIVPVTKTLFNLTHHGILKPPKWDHEGKMRPIDYDLLKNTKEYSHILKTLIVNRETDITFLKRLLDKMNNLKKLIDSEYQK